MTLSKTNNRNRLFPWTLSGIQSFLSSEDFFNDDYFTTDHLVPAMNVKENETNF
ncbi:hypothetical protein [Urechidicola vernalis]|uniref:Uncharacterized protein n=1 Tax=Urechidicola vernalis TaxID=3075600 RepID=A0ABU2Y3C1_9FLAO|nr:hypothetical protein [Urechidicola sp. P050]MDT0552149.1 hypothetical protein [Urechidicola sp. P050]